ncbi:aldehyde dehydrogenase [Lysinibacillus macroides]|uniref:Aldehyde dehydrogenase n=1 Tax=Lysinibacillus macroides TaxID=33935 RepID=A0A0N1J0C5_9BACI|nr:aldehyde dehydrogenase [Lysinibacillus macroides]KOY83841.1 aldehyde dehydrogenase [Lysinibacillus macroides]QPR67116.1 aldehyde dehydrogenase [Lysinibacillus macroides]
MKQWTAYINGQFIANQSAQWMDATYPATGEIVGQVQACTEVDVHDAVHAAKAAFQAWKRTPAYERENYVKKWITLLREEKTYKNIGNLISAEMGKPLEAANNEAFYSADLAEYQSQWARRIDGEIVTSDSTNERILIEKEPLGVVAIIVPWNFPIYVLTRKVIPALIAGNTVVIKPSVKSPISALAIAELFHQAGFPAGVVNVVTGSDDIVGEALTSSEVNMITFTGSTRVGKKIMEKASQKMIRVSLELGGKAPAIVMPDADLNLAVQAIKGGRLSNSGQVCSNTERVYVHESIAQAFIEKIVAAFQDVQVADGRLQPNAEVASLVSKADATRINTMVQTAVVQGATIACGGHIMHELGDSFYAPTILTNCYQQMDIVQQEVFGPVLPILTFKTIDEAIALANDSDYGLTSNIYTNSYQSVMKLTKELEFGEVYVNRQQGEAYQGYHAGWKKSGIGGDDGKHGFEEFLQQKTVYLAFE